MQDPRSIVAAMTVEEKAAQMMFVGFHGAEMPQQYAEWIERTGLGGIILFTRNVKSVEQTRTLTDAIQAAGARSRHALPLAVGIDQEGGTVVRLSEAAGYTHLPSNMALGAAGDAALAYRAARVMAAEMRAVGINWNLAPALDVNNNAQNPVIGVRSYGALPDLVSRLGSAAVLGYQAGGVAACAKHFPGHGDTAVDSHAALPIIRHQRDRLDEVELAPFREAIAVSVDSIMTAHVFFPALETEEGRPATLSRNVITGLLRQELKYEGIITTDCLEMKAIANTYSPEQTALMAVEAGIDVLLVSHTWEKQQAMFRALVEAVHSGRITEERLTESAYRIVRMKLARAMGANLPAPVGCAEHKALALEVARQAVTVAWGADQLPLPKRVLMVLPRAVWFAQVEDSRTVLADFIDGLRSAGIEAESVDCPLDMQGVSVDDLARGAGPGGTVVFGAAGAARNPAQAEVAAALAAAGCRVVVVARRLPYDLNAFPAAVAGIACYDDSPPMQRALAEVLTGQLQASGRLPV